MSATTLWNMPVPSSATLRGPTLHALSRRSCEIMFEIEGEKEGEEQGLILRFPEVAAFKCTYREVCTADVIRAAYGKLVDLGETDWLSEARRARHARPGLRHLMIFFDDGPCYEFLCEQFSVIGPNPIGSKS